jgi:hypothetical protein
MKCTVQPTAIFLTFNQQPGYFGIVKYHDLWISFFKALKSKESLFFLSTAVKALINRTLLSIIGNYYKKRYQTVIHTLTVTFAVVTFNTR